MRGMLRSIDHSSTLTMVHTATRASPGSLSGGHIALHHPVPEWHGLISGVAFPYAPHVIDRGPVYHFMLNHVVEPATPMEPFRIDYRRL